MSTRTLHPRPSLGAVAREQMRAVALAVRPEMLLLAGLLALATGMILYQQARFGRPLGFDFLPQMATPLLFLAFLVPLSVWKDDAPSRRGYHLSMPVERSWHQLTKNASGWLWLMAGLAVYLLWTWMMAALTDGDLGTYRSGFAFRWDGELPESARGTMEAIRREHPSVVLTVPAWQWAVPFVAATVAYLIGSMVALSSDHPWRWMAGVVISYMIILAIMDMAEMDAMQDALESVVDGRYGLRMLFSGEAMQPMGVVRRDGLTVRLFADRPQLGAWLTSTAIWLSLGVAGVLVAANRRRNI